MLYFILTLVLGVGIVLILNIKNSTYNKCKVKSDKYRRRYERMKKYV